MLTDNVRMLRAILVREVTCTKLQKQKDRKWLLENYGDLSEEAMRKKVVRLNREVHDLWKMHNRERYHDYKEESMVGSVRRARYVGKGYHI